ncbi:MAG: hypothetical protein WCF24_11085 [Acidimicrobiales bacterium]
MRTDATLPVPAGQMYRGVDRLPRVPDPTEQQSDVVAKAWTRYLDAWDDGLVGKDLSLARSLAAGLGEAGQPAEVVYVEVVVPPPVAVNVSAIEQREKSLSWVVARSAGVEPPPNDVVRLGLDVATPMPQFHSALLEPELVKKDDRFRASINDSGLVDDLRYAVELMNQANSSGYLLSSFAVLEVSTLP